MLKRLNFGLTIALLAGGLAFGCGGKDDDNGGTGGSGDTGSGGDAGSGDTGSGGTGDTGSGGSGGSGDTGSGGSGDTGSGGAAGGGGTPPGTGSIDDLIRAICEWEFGCCDAGERTYRLGPAAADVEECVTRFSFEYHSSNQTNNPFPAGTATGLLGTLAYVVNPGRVVENPEGIAECIASWGDLSCPTVATAPTYCAETVIPGESPCSLVNLFDPGIELGDDCTLALAEADGNDVECPVGSTCLDASHPDNPETTAICVQRGIATNPCTEDEDCDWNHFCDSAGRCAAKGDVGDPCTFNDPENPVPDDEDAECRAGLRCNPSTLTCVANCSTNYPCTADVECPQGESCAPVTVGSDAGSWHVCRAIGTTASARCDNNIDCADVRRCDGSVCVADQGINDPCTQDSDCEEGSFCDTATFEYTATGFPYLIGRTPSNTCIGYFDAGEPCFPLGKSAGYSSGCNPATVPECVFTPDGWTCTTAKLAAGDSCVPFSSIFPTEPTECAQGLDCEFANQSAADYTCTAGADLSEDCDDNRADGIAQLCAVGLFCDPATSQCVTQVGPGEDCETPAGGSAQSGLCLNNACVENWDSSSTAADFICTDAPVPVSNSGDGLTCNSAG